MSQAILPDLSDLLTGNDQHDVPVEVIQQVIARCITPLNDTETLPLKQALGRVLAQDVISPINVPSYDNSAMDGYAFIATDLSNNPANLNVVGKAYAGHPYLSEVRSGECVRIMTGAAIPRGCDTVIAQELVSDATDTNISITLNAVNAGDNRRLAGEDLRIGSVALRKGKRLSPADIGLLASLGIAETTVIRRPRVAFFSTGDELRSIGQALDEGCVYDSNRYTLHSMLVRAQCEPIDMGVVKDDPASLEKALREACAQADVIITTGGVSAGDADYTRQMRAMPSTSSWAQSRTHKPYSRWRARMPYEKNQDAQNINAPLCRQIPAVRSTSHSPVRKARGFLAPCRKLTVWWF